jgi:hypothetical protein
MFTGLLPSNGCLYTIGCALAGTGLLETSQTVAILFVLALLNIQVVFCLIIIPIVNNNDEIIFLCLVEEKI